MYLSDNIRKNSLSYQDHLSTLLQIRYVWANSHILVHPMSRYVTIAHFTITLFTYQPLQSPIIHKGQAREADGLHRLVRKTQD